jgi:hypothetical protein
MVGERRSTPLSTLQFDYKTLVSGARIFLVIVVRPLRLPEDPETYFRAGLECFQCRTECSVSWAL